MTKTAATKAAVNNTQPPVSVLRNCFADAVQRSNTVGSGVFTGGGLKVNFTASHRFFGCGGAGGGPLRNFGRGTMPIPNTKIAAPTRHSAISLVIPGPSVYLGKRESLKSQRTPSPLAHTTKHQELNSQFRCFIIFVKNTAANTRIYRCATNYSFSPTQ